MPWSGKRSKLEGQHFMAVACWNLIELLASQKVILAGEEGSLCGDGWWGRGLAWEMAASATLQSSTFLSACAAMGMCTFVILYRVDG